MPFTKLDTNIIDSSIWSEPLATRVVWIAFLAKADQNGFVATSYSGMQRSANVPPKEFADAVKCLESPDPDSRTPDHDGRRLEKVDGGWVVLNYRKYRDFSYSGNPEAVRKRVYRAQKQQKSGTSSGHVPICPGHSASASVSVSASVASKQQGGVGGTDTEPTKKPKEKTWRNHLQTYLDQEQAAYDELAEDQAWVADMERLNPGVDIMLTLEKARRFWHSEAGWVKKRERRKVKVINWRTTYENALTQPFNRVWKPREESGTSGIPYRERGSSNG